MEDFFGAAGAAIGVGKINGNNGRIATTVGNDNATGGVDHISQARRDNFVLVAAVNLVRVGVGDVESFVRGAFTGDGMVVQNIVTRSHNQCLQIFLWPVTGGLA